MHGCDQRADANDVNDTLEIAGQHMQCHFGADPFQGFYLEVGVPHPGFDDSERMLNCFTQLGHSLRVFIETLLDSLECGATIKMRE